MSIQLAAYSGQPALSAEEVTLVFGYLSWRLASLLSAIANLFYLAENGWRS
jgi:hypothetical protein